MNERSVQSWWQGCHCRQGEVGKRGAHLRRVDLEGVQLALRLLCNGHGFRCSLRLISHPWVGLCNAPILNLLNIHLQRQLPCTSAQGNPTLNEP